MMQLIRLIHDAMDPGSIFDALILITVTPLFARSSPYSVSKGELRRGLRRPGNSLVHLYYSTFFIKKEDAVNLLGIDFIKRLLLNERLLFQISKTQLTLEASATLQVHFTRGTPRATRAVANHTFETSGGEFVVCGHSGRWWFGVYTSLFVGFQKLGV